MSSACETPFSLSPLTAAETTRVGSSSWQRSHHGRRDLRAFFGHFGLQKPLLVADGPDDDRRRVAVALDHDFKLRHAFRARAHLPRLAHHHHAHAVAGLNQLGRGHVVRGAHGIAAHLLEHADAEGLQAVGQRSAHSGVILMVAGALDLHRLTVEREAMIRHRSARCARRR